MNSTRPARNSHDHSNSKPAATARTSTPPTSARPGGTSTAPDYRGGHRHDGPPGSDPGRLRHDRRHRRRRHGAHGVLGRAGRYTALARGSNSAAWAHDSCRTPRRKPCRASVVGISLATSTTGVPEDAASPTAATAFAAPGPVVVNATPSPPVSRASPSAAYTEVCSCRTTTSPGVPGPESRQNERLCTPGSPKAVVAPARWNTSSTALATVVIAVILHQTTEVTPSADRPASAPPWGAPAEHHLDHGDPGADR